MNVRVQPLPSLDTMVAICREAKASLLDEINRDPELRGDRWRMDREPCLYAIGPNGDRLNDGAWCPWRRRKSDVEQLLQDYPDAVQIVVDSGIDVAENKESFDADNYTPMFWQVPIWKRSEPVYSVEQLEALVRRRTGFRSFAEMLDRARNGYRPSIDTRDPEMVAIANHYDALAEARGDDRRAYRYGASPGGPPAPQPAVAGGPRP